MQERERKGRRPDRRSEITPIIASPKSHVLFWQEETVAEHTPVRDHNGGMFCCGDYLECQLCLCRMNLVRIGLIECLEHPSESRCHRAEYVYAWCLIAILLAHEMGHYLTCRYYRIDATLPYFIPAPTLIGTLGAFIRIRSPITRKHQLFDVGVAGPLAGFVLAVPAMIYGLSLSKVVAPLPHEETIVFGEPLLFKILSEAHI